MKNRLNNFMLGRNGIDQLAIATVIVALILDVVFVSILKISVMTFVSLLLLGYAFFRMMSKNVTKRREENFRFSKILNDIKRGFSDWRSRRSQSKDFKFFSCPSCKSKLRVPKGKGKIKITCSKCGQRFDGKT